MPCLNEAETLARCITKARGFLIRSGIIGEVLIADNGSTDGSQQIAETLGARVVPVPRRATAVPCCGGIRAARGRYVIMGDSDDSYDFSQLDGFVEKLRAGYQLVMGNRFLGGIAPGAMPPLHRYLGNPVLSTVGRVFFRSPCGDFHCGLRGFDREAVLALDLQAPGMEFASEMVVKATIRTAAHRRGADHAVARRPLAPAASEELARRLAAPALPAAVQPALAVPAPGCGAVPGRPGDDGLAAARAAARRGRDAGHPHAVLCRARRGGGLPFDAVLGVRQGLRHARGHRAARSAVHMR